MSSDTFKDLIIGLMFVLSEVLIFQHLNVFGVTPDLLLIYVLWLATKYERVKLILITALLAFIQDALFDFWGINVFSKTLLCFMLYNFISRNKEGRLLLWQIFAVLGIASVIHNVIFLGLSSFLDAYSTQFQPAIFVIGSSLYTATVGSMLFIFKGN